jgi:23S rRNA (pseudouridine1915-N3)-methyltransferase
VLIRFVWVGRTRDAAAAGWIEEYRRRIGRFCPVEIEEIRDAAGKGRDRAARESRELASRLSGRGLLIALDERGRELTSEEFAGFLERSLGSHPELTFILGGSEGLEGDLVASAGVRLSLSRLTFTHELARVLLLEQVYRAFTILKGTPYHR